MEKLNNVGHMTLHCGAGKNVWDGYQESKILAEAIPVSFVNYEFNEVKFPVKTFGAMVDYANVEEMVALYNKYLTAPNSYEKERVFLPKLIAAEQKLQNVAKTPVVDVPKTM